MRREDLALFKQICYSPSKVLTRLQCRNIITNNDIRHQPRCITLNNFGRTSRRDRFFCLGTKVIRKAFRDGALRASRMQ